MAIGSTVIHCIVIIIFLISSHCADIIVIYTLTVISMILVDEAGVCFFLPTI